MDCQSSRQRNNMRIFSLHYRFQFHLMKIFNGQLYQRLLTKIWNQQMAAAKIYSVLELIIVHFVSNSGDSKHYLKYDGF